MRGDAVLWFFSSTFLKSQHNEFGWCSSTAALGSLTNPLVVTHTLDANGIPQQFLSFITEEKTYNNAGQDTCYGLFPRSAIDMDDGTTLIFYEKVKVNPTDMWKWERIGAGLARMSANNITATREPELLFAGPGFVFGQVALKQGADLYLYGCRGTIFVVVECAVARAPLAQANKRTAYRVWDGAQWNDDFSKAQPVLTSGQYSTSIAWNEYLGKFIAVYNEYQSNRIVWRTAPRPEGPWSNPMLLFESQKPSDEKQNNFDAVEQPVFATNGGRTIVVSYHQPLSLFASQIRLAQVTFK
jgi:hypothetical protein